MNLMASLVRWFGWGTRASPENPSTSLANPDAWLFDALGAKASYTGARVSESTALQVSAVMACVRVIAESVASLPLQVFARRPGGGEDLVTDHALYRLLHDRPNPEMTSFDFRETLTAHVLTWGNGYAEIETNNAGRVLGLWPLLPDRTIPKRTDSGVKFYETTIRGNKIPLPADRVLHVHGLGFDGQVGYSPIAMARQAIGMAMAAEEYGARFFGNNASPSGVLEHPGPKGLSKEAKARLRTDWQALHGGLSNAQRVAILDEGMKWQSIGIPQKDAQFLETRKFQTNEIARIYRVPPHMIGDLERATFSNIEHQSIEFVVHTLRPWLARWEQEMDWSLFSDRDRWKVSTRFNVEGLLRGDAAQRSAFYKTMFEIGAYSPNDIREKESLNPVPGGDIRLVPLNMVSLENAGKMPESAEPESEPEPEATPRAMAIERLLADVSRRMVQREVRQIERAIKRGESGFDAWLTEFYAAHQEAVRAALGPALQAVALLGGMGIQAAEERARYHAASVATSWGHQAMAVLRAASEAEADDWAEHMTGALHEWARDVSQGRVMAVLGPVTTAMTTRILIQGRAA